MSLLPPGRPTHVTVSVPLDLLHADLTPLCEAFAQGRWALSVKEAARLLGVSSRKLPKALSELTGTRGMTYPKFRSAFRLALAAAMLAQTDLPIGRIALAVGYEERANFDRMFVRAKSVTPAAFRRLGGSGHTERAGQDIDRLVAPYYIPGNSILL